MGRLGINTGRQSLLNDFAVLHDHDAVADLSRHPQVMGDKQHGQVEAYAHVIKQFQHLRLNRHIKRRHRFVGNQHFRFHGKRTGDADALALAAGELVREPVQRLRRQSDNFHQIARALQGLSM